MVNPPYLPLRAGESGPFVDWGYWLRNLYKNVQVRRLWYDQQSPSQAVPPGTLAPGIEVAAVNIDCSAEDASITGQLHYLILAWMTCGPPGAAASYPIGTQAHFNAEPAGGSPELLKVSSYRPVPTNPPADFSFFGDVTPMHLAAAGTFDPFVAGTNRIWLGATVTGGTQAIVVQSADLLVAELATAPGNLILTP